MKAIGFLHGLAGDLVMCTAAAREFKKIYPDSHLTFSCSKKFENILPLFSGHPNIDAFKVWDNDNGHFSDSDKRFLEQEKFDYVFDPLAKHTHPNWYNVFHYIQETLMMLKFPVDKTTDTQLYLPPPTNIEHHYDQESITIAAWPSQGTQPNKSMTMDNWVKLVKELNKKGYFVYQLGGQFDVPIEGAQRLNLSFLDAAKLLYMSKLSITTDTSWAWIASAYKHNNIGLYGYNYPDMIHPWSHLPTNPNSKYIIKESVQQITAEDILELI